jgi:AcrR family transcriptional regulator
MGRKAGVTADDTRRDLLGAAARVFALKGYDGASIADITNEAGLSSGAIYAHYGSKAELFVAVVRAHARQNFSDLAGLERRDDLDTPAERITDVAGFFVRAGSSYAGREPSDAALMIEAIVASKRHPEVAELVASWMEEGESVLADVIRAAQAQGLADASTSAAALSRFVMMVGLGARLASALQLPAVDRDEWSALIEQLVDVIRPHTHPDVEHDLQPGERT